jgi:hypothetical protein
MESPLSAHALQCPLTAPHAERQEFIWVITRTRVMKQRSSNLHRSTPAVPRMEPLWSPVVATSGNQRQID